MGKAEEARKIVYEEYLFTVFGERIMLPSGQEFRVLPRKIDWVVDLGKSYVFKGRGNDTDWNLPPAEGVEREFALLFYALDCGGRN